MCGDLGGVAAVEKLGGCCGSLWGVCHGSLLATRCKRTNEDQCGIAAAHGAELVQAERLRL